MLWCSARPGTRGLAADAAEEAVVGLFVVEAGAKVDPGQASEEARQVPFVRPARSGKKDRNDVEVRVAGAEVEGSAHLLGLPQSELYAYTKTAHVRFASRAFSRAGCRMGSRRKEVKEDESKIPDQGWGRRGRARIRQRTTVTASPG